MNPLFPTKNHIFIEYKSFQPNKLYICKACDLKMMITNEADNTEEYSIMYDKTHEFNAFFEQGYFYKIYSIHFNYIKYNYEIEKVLYQSCNQRIIKQIIE